MKKSRKSQTLDSTQTCDSPKKKKKKKKQKIGVFPYSVSILYPHITTPGRTANLIGSVNHIEARHTKPIDFHFNEPLLSMIAPMDKVSTERSQVSKTALG